MEKEKQFSEIKREILLSIKPEYLVKILNGEKTIEIRKTMPKCELPCRVWLYCSKGKKHEFLIETVTGYQIINVKDGYIPAPLNGKVVGSFILNKVRCFEIKYPVYGLSGIFEIKRNAHYLGELQCNNIKLLKESCLSSKQLEKYIQDKNGDIIDKRFYGWCISDLNILDKPFDLWNDGYFGNPKTKLRILKAPQSWCYCKYDKDGFLPF